MKTFSLPDFQKDQPNVSFFTIFKQVTKAFPLSLLFLFVLGLVWAIDLSARPYMLKFLLDSVAGTPFEGMMSQAMWPAIGWIALSFTMLTFYRLYNLIIDIHMIPHLRQQIGQWASKKMLHQSHAFYQDQLSGSLSNKVNDLIHSIPEIMKIVTDRFFPHSLGLFIAIVALYQVDYRFSLMMIVWALPFIIGAVFYSRKLVMLSDAWSETTSKVTGIIVDFLSNILSVRLFSRQSYELYNIENKLAHSCVAEQKLQWAQLWMWMLFGYSFVLVQALNFYFLILGRQNGWVTVGDFALVIMINVNIVSYLRQMGDDVSQFSRQLGKVRQSLKVMYTPLIIQDKEGAPSLIIDQGQIRFDQVGFQYGRESFLFKNKSVILESGQKIGLVGYSGGGKTTFVNLILRLFDVTEGSIKIDEQDIRSVSQDSLRKQITMIPQDPTLFHRTLLDNIRYGDPHASIEKVIEAAEKAHAHDFIQQLPKRYDSLVGERGVKLSGGQRQRIAIARAFLKNAPILILDEATSQLDSLTEKDIQQSLWELMNKKTTVVIAHRLSTLLKMDRILVFDQGTIVEDGNHDFLIAHQGLYKKLWDTQVGGFILDVTE